MHFKYLTDSNSKVLTILSLNTVAIQNFPLLLYIYIEIVILVLGKIIINGTSNSFQVERSALS